MDWKAFDQLISATPPERLGRVLEEVNNDLKDSLVLGESFGRADVFSLCRLVTFMGLVVKSPSRSRKKEDEEKPIPVSWKAIADDLNAFVTDTCPPPLGGTAHPLLFNNFDNRKVTAFASLGHSRGGNPDRNFYVTILLYLYYQWSEGNFDSKLFRSLASRSDRNSPVRAVQALAEALQYDVPFVGEPETRNVTIPFEVVEQNEAKFRSYFDDFSMLKRPKPGEREPDSVSVVPRLRQLQFIIYRPMATDASKIMRSYLSVFFRVGPIGLSSDLNFSHFVSPPSFGQRPKIATGKVVPLNNTVYMIGGQRTAGRRKTKPYDTAKIMALDPHAIEKGSPLVPMLALSSRNDGRPIVSRAIARVTPFDHSSAVDFSPIRQADLEAALLEECRRERAYLDDHPILEDEEKERVFNSYPLPLGAPPSDMKKSESETFTEAQRQIQNVARQFLVKCNNTPDPHSGISVPPGYNSEDRALSKAELNAAIEDLLLKYRDESGQAYKIWEDTLFGPITLGS